MVHDFFYVQNYRIPHRNFHRGYLSSAVVLPNLSLLTIQEKTNTNIIKACYEPINSDV